MKLSTDKTNGYACRLIILLMISFFLYSPSHAQNYIFAQLKGSPVNTTGWNLQGAANVGNITSTGNSEIIVCPVAGASGAIFYNQPINLSLCSKWKAEFDFRMFDGTGADGLTFCFLDVPPVGFVTGGGLGVPASANGLKVCFDIWNNCIPFDASTVHLNMPKIELRWGAGYDECSPLPTKENTDGGMSFIRSNAYAHAKITYDGGQIGVYVNDILYLTGFQIFNYSGYLGFTASTGGYSDNHSIKNVVIYTEMPPSEAGTSAGICPNNVVQLGTASTDGYIYSWSPTAGLNATNIADPVVKLDNNSGVIENHVYYVNTSFSNNPGCKSVDSVTIKVYPRPVVDFVMPEICLNDATAAFTNSSFTNEPSTLPFSYQWKFGDKNATVANPDISAAVNASHKYSAAANYNVQLAVKNIQGCSDSSVKIFTVNGAIPRADFTINNTQVLCSNKAVEIKNTSGVDFGSVTKIEIAWGDSAGVVLTDNDPFPGKIYHHLYPYTLVTSVTNYTIHYTAYSGITCLDEFTKVVSLQPAPDVIFPPVPSLCVDASSALINVATEAAGLQGMFVYSGNGTTADGLLNPQQAGAGIHTLVAEFTAANTCTDSAHQVINVLALPVVDAGPGKDILEGGSIVIKATAKGTDLQYLWTPSLYLGNDAVLNPVSTPLQDITYTLKVTGTGGCNMSDSVTFKVYKNPYIPNAFSPNGDGLNDRWEIKYLDTYPGCTVDIYNRFGQLVFHSTGYNTPWDGMYKGKPAATGAYAYIVNTKKHIRPFVGTVMIVR